MGLPFSMRDLPPFGEGDAHDTLVILQAFSRQRRGARTLIITAANKKTIVVGLAADSGQ